LSLAEAKEITGGIQQVLASVQVAEAHEAELASAPASVTLDERGGSDNEPPDGPLYVGMDGGYVRSREQGWFEAIAGKSLLSFHRDGRVPDRSGRCFAFIQTVDDKPSARLADTLRQQGMQPRQKVVFLSDGHASGGENPRIDGAGHPLAACRRDCAGPVVVMAELRH